MASREGSELSMLLPLSMLPKPFFFGGEHRAGFSVGRNTAGTYSGPLGCLICAECMRRWAGMLKVLRGEIGDWLEGDPEEGGVIAACEV